MSKKGSFGVLQMTTSISQHGSVLAPSFKAAVEILKFPFDFLLQQINKVGTVSPYTVGIRSTYRKAVLST